MVIKWIKAIFKGHIIRILKGNLFRLFKMKDPLYKTRYLYCKNCANKEDSPIGELCGLCGCPLKSKLRVLDEKCEMNKF